MGIFNKWNNQYWRFVFHIVDAQGPILAGIWHTEKDRKLHRAPKCHN